MDSISRHFANTPAYFYLNNLHSSSVFLFFFFKQGPILFWKAVLQSLICSIWCSGLSFLDSKFWRLICFLTKYQDVKLWANVNFACLQCILNSHLFLLLRLESGNIQFLSLPWVGHHINTKLLAPGWTVYILAKNEVLKNCGDALDSSKIVLLCIMKENTWGFRLSVFFQCILFYFLKYF